MSAVGKLLARWPTLTMLRVASVMGLVSLALVCWGTLDPEPLALVASMSLSPAFGGVAFLLFGLSIAADLAQTHRRAEQRPGPGAP